MQDYTPLLDLPGLARTMRFARIWVKDESKRPLGNFKSLGGARAAAAALARSGPKCPTLICASDGNHGLAVAAAAKAHGTRARVYLPAQIGAARVARIEAFGAEIVRVDGSYDVAVETAKQAAGNGEGILIPDTSPDADDPVVADVMAGYGRIPGEMIEQLGRNLPTHIFVQAGVGGLAAALAAGLARGRAATTRIVVVEPASAACVGAALSAGEPVQVAGTLETCAEMLSCGLASASAVRLLKRANCQAITVDEAALGRAPALLAQLGGPETTPSGAAGMAGAFAASADPALRSTLGLNGESRVMLLVTEGPLMRG